MSKNLKNQVICQDANTWLQENKNLKCIITSLPDMEEIGKEFNQWKQWVEITCKNLCNSISKDGIIFFYQTDRKYKGVLIDKKTLISSIFLQNGFELVISKIVLKQSPETKSLFRPGYTNLFAFSRTVKSGRPTPDVFPAGEMLYKNAMGFNAVKCCIDLVKEKKITDKIVDPFCGHGSVLKIANENGFYAIGIDIDKNQCSVAKKLLK